MTKKIVFFGLAVLLTQIKNFGAVNTYCFHQLLNSNYTSITGGTVHASGASIDNGIYNTPIGFTFNFNGANYTTLNISSNGFVTFGATAPAGTNYTPISSSATYSGAISAFGANLVSSTSVFFTPEIRSETIGTAPYRQFVIQWSDLARSVDVADDDFSFEIILYETTNQIDIKYAFGLTGPTSATVQVGLRGSSNTDYNNRKTAPWDATVAGTANTSNINTNDVDMPNDLLCFSFTPLSTPTIQASNIHFTNITHSKTTVRWTNGDGSYRMVVAKAGATPAGTPVNGTTYTASSSFGSGNTIAAGEYVVYYGQDTSVTVSNLQPNTTYGYRVYEGSCNYLSTTSATNPLTQATNPATSVPCGNVYGTWTQAASPYLIYCDVTIPNDSTLTIEPGVSVEFQGAYNIAIAGRIIAQGTVADTIKFTTISSSGTGCLRFDNTASTNDTSKISYCNFNGLKALGSAPFNSGSALYFKNVSKAIVTNSRIQNGKSSSFGNGIYCEGSSPVISNNIIYDNIYNKSTGGGGGIYCGANSNPVITGNLISNNAIYFFNSSTFSTTYYPGGGIYCLNSNPSLVNNIIVNNQGSTGGGIYFNGSSPTILNNTIANNKVSSGGGAIYCTSSSNPTFKNSVLYGNTITSANQVSLGDQASDPAFYYCDIQGGSAAFTLNGNTYTGTYQNNINSNPLFVAPTTASGTGQNGSTANWSLQNTSPCKDAGDPNSTSPSSDYSGSPRINVCRIDMGAYEYQTGTPLVAALTQTQPIACAADSVAVVATASGGLPPYTFTWSNSTVNDTAVLGAGTYTVTITESSIGCSVTKTITLTEPSVLTLSVSKTDVSCNGGSNGIINVTAGGGTGTIQYSADGGSNFQPSNLFTGLTQATYSLVIKDDNNCTTQTTAVITEPSAVTFSAVTTDLTCASANNGTISFSASGGTGTIVYSIDGGNNYQASNNFSDLPAGTYILQVKDANNCFSSQQTVTIAVMAVSPLGITTSVSNTICGSSSGSISALGSGGTLPYTYSFTSGYSVQINSSSVSAAATNLGAGTYSVTFTDANGCSFTSATQTVGTDPADFSIAFSANPTSGTMPFMTGFTNSTPSPAAYNFTWNFGDGNTSNNNSPAVSHTYQFSGFYDVSLIATNISTGCKDTLIKTSYIFVSGCQHTAVISPVGPISVCQGDTVHLKSNTDPVFAYQWEVNSQLISGATDSLLDVTQTGYYSVTITKSGCQVTSGAVQITFNARPSEPVINVSGSISACSGGTVVLDATIMSGVSYLWNTGAATQSISTDSLGTYIVVVTNTVSGCSSSSLPLVIGYSNSVTPDICMVTVDSISQNNIIFWDKTSYAMADSFLIYRDTANNNYALIGVVSYDSLSMFADTMRTLYAANGDPNVSSWRYKIAVKDTCGAIGPMSPFHQSMFFQDNGGNFNWSPYQVEGQVIPVPALQNYLFKRDDLSTGVWNTIQTLSASSTLYTDPNYATYQSTASWRVETQWNISCDPLRSIVNTSRSNIKHQMISNGMENSAVNSFTVYPNPAKDQVTIDFNSALKNPVIEIFDMTGRIVLWEKISGNENRNSISTQNLGNGVYTLRLTNDNGKMMKKLVIEK